MLFRSRSRDDNAANIAAARAEGWQAHHRLGVLLQNEGELTPALHQADRALAHPPAPEGVTAYKLSSNENPFPPLDAVRVVLDKALDVVNRYPDMASVDLIGAIAAFVGCDPANIAVGTGSVGILGQIIQATCDPGDEVVFAWRSFEAYPIVAASARPRARARAVALRPPAPEGAAAQAAASAARVRGWRRTP